MRFNSAPLVTRVRICCAFSGSRCWRSLTNAVCPLCHHPSPCSNLGGVSIGLVPFRTTPLTEFLSNMIRYIDPLKMENSRRMDGGVPFSWSSRTCCPTTIRRAARLSRCVSAISRSNWWGFGRRERIGQLNSTRCLRRQYHRPMIKNPNNPVAIPVMAAPAQSTSRYQGVPSVSAATPAALPKRDMAPTASGPKALDGIPAS